MDLCFNRIKKIENLDGVKRLEKLYLTANKIVVIENIAVLSNLTLLELGDNRIKVNFTSYDHYKI